MFAGPFPPTDANKLIKAIRDQTEGVPNHLVFVLDFVSVRFGGYFTPEIKAEIQRFPYLQMLTLNDCGIKSVENFPHLPGLIRLDLVFNEITGESLTWLKGSRHLQTLMLGANKIEKIEDLVPLTSMKQLLQLDLINNPVSRIPGYREKVFNMFKTITILDTLDKAGKDAYNNASMIQSVSRVPDALFDKSPSVPAASSFFSPTAPVFGKPPVFGTAPVFGASYPTTALLSGIPSVIPSSAAIRSKTIASKASKISSKSKSNIGKAGKVGKVGKGGKSKSTLMKASRSTSSRAGIVFPSARVQRKLKQAMPGVRVGKAAAIYTASVLQYLTAELLQIAGNQAKTQKKQRITPQLLKHCLRKDEELSRYLNTVTFGMNDQ